MGTQCVQEEVMVQGPTQYTSQTHCPPPVCTTTQAPPVCTTSCAPVATACAQPVVEQHPMDVECQQCLIADEMRCFGLFVWSIVCSLWNLLVYSSHFDGSETTNC